MDIGPTELIIILLIVVLLFGVGRIGRIAGELGQGIRAFKDGLQGEDEQAKTTNSSTVEIKGPEQPGNIDLKQ